MVWVLPVTLSGFFLLGNSRVVWLSTNILLEYYTLERESLVALMVLDLFSRTVHLDYFTQSLVVGYLPVVLVNLFMLYSLGKQFSVFDLSLCILLFLVLYVVDKHTELLSKLRDSYASSLREHRDILKCTGITIIITDLEGILIYNNAVKNAVLAENPLGQVIYNVFPLGLQPQLKSFFNTLRRTNSAEEIITQLEPPAFQLKLSGAAIVYKQRACFQISMVPLDSILQQTCVKHEFYERLQLKNEEISTIFSFLYKYNEGISPQELELLRAHCSDLRNMMYFEEVLRGSLTLLFSQFSLKKELCAIIDTVWLNAQRKKLSIFLSQEQSLRESIKTDKSKFLCIFNATLNFAMKYATQRSSIRILCKKLYDFQQEIEIKFRFTTQLLTTDALNLIYSYRLRQDNRKTMEGLVFLIERYGMDIALIDHLLESLNGYVYKANVDEELQDAVIAYRVQYTSVARTTQFQSHFQLLRNQAPCLRLERFTWENRKRRRSKRFPVSLHALQRKAREVAFSNAVSGCFSGVTKEMIAEIPESSSSQKLFYEEEEEEFDTEEGPHNVSSHIDIHSQNIAEISSDSLSSQDLDTTGWPVVVISKTGNTMSSLVQGLIESSGNFPLQVGGLQHLLDNFTEVLGCAAKGMILVAETATDFSLLTEVQQRLAGRPLHVLGLSSESEAARPPFKSICSLYVDDSAAVPAVLREIAEIVKS